MKFRPVRAEIFQQDKETDIHDEANSGFPQFCDTPKKFTYFCSQFSSTSTSNASDTLRLTFFFWCHSALG